MEEERKDPYSHYKEIALTQQYLKIKLLYFLYQSLQRTKKDISVTGNGLWSC
jgi:hypothetical protein